MDRSTVTRIEEWDTRPTSDGYVGLAELADDGFTGAVSAAGTHLLMANGKIVGVANGTISAFEGAAVTAYEAPDPALPLLFAMQDREGEVRGSYYTDDTPIREVDETLTEGGFTGYLELSENVLSGDYFVVYYGGRSLAVAFVGNKGRVVTGDEAFQLAADEVGIYEVTDVALEVTEVPEPPEPAGGGVAADEPAPEEAEEGPPAEDDPATDPASADEVATEETGPAPADGERTEPDTDEETEAGIPDAEGGDAPDTTGASVTEPEGGDSVEEPAEATVEEPAEATVEAGDSRSSTGGSGGATTGDGSAERQPPRSDDAPPAEPDERFEEEARWRETRTVPALDPEESAESAESTEPQPEPSREPVEERPSEPAVDDAAVQALRERLQRLERELRESERERERLEGRVETIAEERDEVEAEREALESRIEELESQLEAARSAGTSATPTGTASSSGGQPIDPGTALDQTDLFVRYGSKSKATLETAHGGQADAEAVAENLRIDSHSRFDSASATVNGRPFAEFLSGTIQYRFVSWLVEVLLYEIRETGTEGKLRALYDVLPEIDRAEFNGTVASTDEEGNTVSETFDVVCRNRMGKALIVANINDSLDPATGEMMATLVEDTTEVAEAHESVGAAFLVTASFFQPDALETAADATRGGGFLSRDSKKSFVKLSRSGGYHLCLVEARGDDFHVAVPEF